MASQSPTTDRVPISHEVLALLRCPNTAQPLEVRTVSGAVMLVTADGRFGYPVRDGIPILLPDAAIALGALKLLKD